MISTFSLSHLLLRFSIVNLPQKISLKKAFKLSERRGPSLTIKSEQYEVAHFEYEDIRIDFSIREKQKQVRRPLNKDEKRWYPDREWMKELQPSGKLIFSIKTHIESGMRHEWTEKENNSMESQLPDIVATLTVAGPILVERERQRREEERRWREAEHQRYLQEQARKRDENRWRRFLEYSQNREQAKLARAFIAALEANITDTTQEAGKKTLAEWLAWARDWADQYDPLTREIPAIFNEISAVDSWTYN